MRTYASSEQRAEVSKYVSHLLFDCVPRTLFVAIVRIQLGHLSGFPHCKLVTAIGLLESLEVIWVISSRAFLLEASQKSSSSDLLNKPSLPDPALACKFRQFKNSNFSRWPKSLNTLCVRTQARRTRIVTKIPHMEPEQLSLDFLTQLNNSFSQHPTRPQMIVGMAMQAGCIELVMDLVSLSEGSAEDGDANLDPTQPLFPDPSVWLQHLHVNPPPGTQVLTQACGRWVLGRY